MALLRELRRRKVFQVAISYLIVAWLLTQVSDTLAPALRLPEWFHSGVVFLLLLGFPVALFFAWAFELTPEGLKRDQRAANEEDPASGNRLNVLIIALLAVSLGYFVYDELFIERGSWSLTDEPATPIESDPKQNEKSIAVLPFVDMSPDKDQEYMSDGIAEELLNLLAKISELDVTSRSSAFSFKGKNMDIPRIAEQLRVSYVLEGSVRKAGDRIRITAQLIEAASDKHLWSETYDRTLDDVFAIQDEIGAAVVDALEITLLGDAPRATVVDGAAYDLALEARYFWNRRAPGDVERALELYQQAIEIQPDYALAWAGISVALAVQALAGDIPLEDGLQRARAAAEKALELDPMLADAHVRMGQAHLRARELAAAYRAYQRALELEPDNVLALGVMGGYLRAVGRIDEAIAYLQRTVELDPLGAIWHCNLSSLLIQGGRYEEALPVLERCRELNPAAPIERDLAIIALMQGNPEEALRLVEGLEQERVRGDLMVAIFQELGMHEESDATLAALQLRDHRRDEYLLPGAYAARGEVEKAYQALEDIRPEIQGRRGAVEYDAILRHYLAGDARWVTFLDSLDARE